MNSCQVKHINLSVRELYYMADFWAEIRLKGSSSFSLCGFKDAGIWINNSLTVARKLSNASVVYLVGPVGKQMECLFMAACTLLLWICNCLQLHIQRSSICILSSVGKISQWVIIRDVQWQPSSSSSSSSGKNLHSFKCSQMEQRIRSLQKPALSNVSVSKWAEC